MTLSVESLEGSCRGDDGDDGDGGDDVGSCFLLLQNVGSVRAVITVHYQAKGKLRIVKIRCVVSGNKEIMVTYHMFRSRGHVSRLRESQSASVMDQAFS